MGHSIHGVHVFNANLSGMYEEMERVGTNLNEIDGTDCENSLESLQVGYFTMLSKMFVRSHHCGLFCSKLQ